MISFGSFFTLDRFIDFWEWIEWSISSLVYEVSAILRSGRNKTKSKKSKKKKDSANDETISGGIGAADSSGTAV